MKKLLKFISKFSKVVNQQIQYEYKIKKQKYVIFCRLIMNYQKEIKKISFTIASKGLTNF